MQRGFWAIFFGCLFVLFGPGAEPANATVLKLRDVYQLSPGQNYEALASNSTSLYGAEIISDYLFELDGQTSFGTQTQTPIQGQFVGASFQNSSTLWLSTGSQIHKYDLSGGNSVLSSISAPAGSYGITWLGDTLFAANFSLDQILRYGADGAYLGTFAAPSTDTRELFSFGQFLFAFDQDTDLLYTLDPLSGQILSSTALPDFNDSVAQAMTIHQGRLLVYGLQTNSLYAYSITGLPEPTPAILLLLGLIGLYLTHVKVLNVNRKAPGRNRAL